MNFDLRLPIGLMFTLFGGMLSVYGMVTDHAMYEKSLGININLAWGLCLLVFGVIMLTLALRSRGKNGKGGDQPPR